MANSLRDQKALALADQVTESARRRHGKDGKDGETKIVKEVIVERDDEAIKALEEKILKLKAERTEPANDQEVIPAAIGDLHKEIHSVGNLFDDFRKQCASQLADLHRRIQELEKRPTEIVTAEPAELQDEIKQVADVAQEIGAAALCNFSIQQREIEDLKGRVARLDLQLSTFFAHIERPKTGG